MKTEMELRACLADLIAVCQRHGMAVVNQDDDGFALVEWAGHDAMPAQNPILIEGPTILMGIITPDITADANGREREFIMSHHL